MRTRAPAQSVPPGRASGTLSPAPAPTPDPLSENMNPPARSNPPLAAHGLSIPAFAPGPTAPAPNCVPPPHASLSLPAGCPSQPLSYAPSATLLRSAREAPDTTYTSPRIAEPPSNPKPAKASTTNPNETHYCTPATAAPTSAPPSKPPSLGSALFVSLA